MSVDIETEAVSPGQPLGVEQIEGAFERATVPPARLSVAYRLGLLLVAAATVLLVLVYLGLIGAVGYLVVLHAVANRFIVERSASFGAIMMYGGPLALGGIFLFFMVKPLLAPRTATPPKLELTPGEAPLLYALIERIRRAVGAPAPRVVQLDCHVNAAASFRRGVWSLLSNDLALTIGLPLIHGMTTRQLAGVLAHELGHFAQGSSLRLTFLIRAINGWFARVVFERDAWDERLRRTASWDIRLGIVFHLARALVWATRQILRGLMLAGHAIGMFMLRQMEYDADRYEARLVGSDEFAGTALRMRVLSVGHMQALRHLQRSWAQRRLCDDLPGLTERLAARLPPDVLALVATQDPEEAKPGVFDTHPPDGARIASAEAERAPGIFRLQRPAAELLPNLAEISRRATGRHYREVIELEVTEANLVPLARFLADATAVEEAAQAADRYFDYPFSVFHPLALPAQLPPAAPSVEAAAPAIRSGAEELAKIAAARRAAPADTERPPWTYDPEDLGRAREAACKRVGAALSLLGLPAVRVAEEVAREAARLLALLAALGERAPALCGLAVSGNEAAGTIRRHLERGDESSAALALARLGGVYKATRELAASVESISYPFEHAQAGVSVAGYLRANLPEVAPNDAAVLDQVEEVLRRSHALYARALGRLAQIALELETAAGVTTPEP